MKKRTKLNISHNTLLYFSAGFIGRLKLEIPYSSPKSQPWIICIDKLYIVAGPPLSVDNVSLHIFECVVYKSHDSSLCHLYCIHLLLIWSLFQQSSKADKIANVMLHSLSEYYQCQFLVSCK